MLIHIIENVLRWPRINSKIMLGRKYSVTAATVTLADPPLRGGRMLRRLHLFARLESNTVGLSAFATRSSPESGRSSGRTVRIMKALRPCCGPMAIRWDTELPRICGMVSVSSAGSSSSQALSVSCSSKPWRSRQLFQLTLYGALMR